MSIYESPDDKLTEFERSEFYRRRYQSTVVFSIIIGIMSFIFGFLLARLIYHTPW